VSRHLIAGNWKMNGRLSAALALADALAVRLKAGAPACEVAVFPPFTAIHAVRQRLGDAPLGLGGQDCHREPHGAFTGDVSAPMLADLGCAYVIVGHSERRHGHGETNAHVAAKAEAAITAGLIPIICIGETEAERDAGRTRAVLRAQLEGSLPPAETEQVVVAYEPVWAIGTGRTAGAADVAATHAYIRADLRRHLGDAAEGVRILYGGSVKAENAGALLAVDNVDGALVGGASLKAESFLGIARAAGG
jgi:triosephosphate isomerase